MLHLQLESFAQVSPRILKVYPIMNSILKAMQYSSQQGASLVLQRCSAGDTLFSSKIAGIRAQQKKSAFLSFQ